MSYSEDENTADRQPLATSSRADNLLASLDTISRTKRRSDALSQYRKFAKWHARSVNMFTDFHDVLEAGTRWEVQEYGDMTREQFERKHRTNLAVYKRMRAEIPPFREDMYRMQEGSKIDAMVTVLNLASSRARGEDIGSLAPRVIEYVRFDQPDKVIVPHISALAPKKARGHNHPVLSRLLCPGKYLDDFDNDPEGFRKKLLNGTVKVFAQDLPALLYHASGYDKDHVRDGLFRNETLVRVFKHIFTSPTSALDDENDPIGKTKAPQAKLNGMKRVTIGSILYAAVMFRHAISTVKDWRYKDKLFVQEDFFNEMMAEFEDEDDDWVKDTLDWWNRRVFEKSDIDEELLSDSERRREPSTAELARAQRHRARARQPATQHSSQATSVHQSPGFPQDPPVHQSVGPSQEWGSQSGYAGTQFTSQDYGSRHEPAARSPRRRSASPRTRRDYSERPIAPRRRSRSSESGTNQRYPPAPIRRDGGFDYGQSYAGRGSMGYHDSGQGDRGEGSSSFAPHY